MSQLVETIKENRWRNGLRFLHLMNINALSAGAEADVLICVGDKNVVIENVSVEANVEKLTWQIFVGTEFTPGTGSNINKIPRNSVVDTTSSALVTLNPEITATGQSLTQQPMNLVAQIFRNNLYYMKEYLIENDFVFESNRCYLIRLKNTSSDITDIQFNISTANT